MLVYEGLKSDFINDVVDDRIADVIRNNIYNKMGRYPSENEYN